jgi:hypothetical protein
MKTSGIRAGLEALSKPSVERWWSLARVTYFLTVEMVTTCYAGKESDEICARYTGLM